MRRAWMCLTLVTACGRVHFDALATTDGSTSDGFVLPSEPFTNVQVIPNINDNATADDDPTLTADMLEIIFDSERASAGGDLYSSTRAELSSPWSTPVVIAELSTPADEDGPCLAADSLSMTFGSDRPGGGGLNDLYETTRPTRTSAWTTPVRIVELSTASYESHLCVSMDGLAGVFYSDSAGTDDLFEVRRSTRTSAWEPAVTSEVSGSTIDADPTIDAPGHVLVFDSDRVGGSNGDILIATRTSPDAAFTPPVPLDGVNTAVSESDPWLSPDFRTLVFVRRLGAARDIYMATR